MSVEAATGVAGEVATVEISTPGALTPIRRTGLARAALAGLTVRQVIDELTVPAAGLSFTPPATQLEAESRALLGIRELVDAGWGQVWVWQDGAYQPVSAASPAAALISESGELKLDLRPAEERPPVGERRRRSDAAAAELAPLHVTASEEAAADRECAPTVDLIAIADASTLVRDPVAREVRRLPRDLAESHGYVRKTDWLRAQFLPEIELLDFRGLFVGNKGLWILEDPEQRGPIPADPARVADLLSRGNGYRRSGNHVKALMCYQELVELDPHNADFRFLLETTYQAIAAGGSGK